MEDRGCGYFGGERAKTASINLVVFGYLPEDRAAHSAAFLYRGKREGERVRDMRNIIAIKRARKRERKMGKHWLYKDDQKGRYAVSELCAFSFFSRVKNEGRREACVGGEGRNSGS